MTADPAEHRGDYDDYAAEYRILAERRDRAGVDGDPMGILPRLLVEEFAAAGLSVTRLADLPAMASGQEPDSILPAGFRFPRFMLLALVKAG
jgi:hypothetical protein